MAEEIVWKRDRGFYKAKYETFGDLFMSIDCGYCSIRIERGDELYAEVCFVDAMEGVRVVYCKEIIPEKNLVEFGLRLTESKGLDCINGSLVKTIGKSLINRDYRVVSEDEELNESEGDWEELESEARAKRNKEKLERRKVREFGKGLSDGLEALAFPDEISEDD